MTRIITANVAGVQRGETVTLSPSRGRRRLSTVMRLCDPGRQHIVTVHRRGQLVPPRLTRDVIAERGRMRADWPRCTLGKHDTVLITILPAGGGGGAGIGLAIASIALLALAPYAAPFLAGAIGLGGALGAGAVLGSITGAQLVGAGLAIGALGLSLAASRALSAQQKVTGGTIANLQGGGNLPKPNGRKPLWFGRFWMQPPLSQADVQRYEGSAGNKSQLFKRVTLRIGKAQVYTIRFGQSVFWTKDGGIQAPFEATSQIEFLDGTAPSAILPGDIITAPDVAGIGLPYTDGNPSVTPWYKAQPDGVSIDQIEVEAEWPSGLGYTATSGVQKPLAGNITFQYQALDSDGTPTGDVMTLFTKNTGAALTDQAVRITHIVSVTNGSYQVRGQNNYSSPADGVRVAAQWDALRGLIDDARVRPNTAEIVVSVVSNRGLSAIDYSQMWVEACGIDPVWNGSAWADQENQRAVWAMAALVRQPWGLDEADNFDIETAVAIDGRLGDYGEFNGLLPDVSRFHQAANEVLFPSRAEHVQIGTLHSLVRDESVTLPRFVFTRREIVDGSGGLDFTVAKQDGEADYIIDYDRGGDPTQPDYVENYYSTQSRTPKRMKVNGVTTPEHATMVAQWLVAVAVFRGETRQMTAEWDGRLVKPGDHILADHWFLDAGTVAGVDSASGNTLTLDCDVNLPTTEWGYASLRNRLGREWGICRAKGDGARGLVLNDDDVTSLTTSTGLALADVLARDIANPTTVKFSSSITVLQDSYVAKTASPQDDDHVAITMVVDDPRVYTYMDETPVSPSPLDPVLTDPTDPVLLILRARPVQIENTINVAWSVGPVAGMAQVEVDISYDYGTLGDDATWTSLTGGPTPAISGQAPLRQSDDPVTLRARPYNAAGIPGAYIYTTFTTIPPLVDGSDVDPGTLALAAADAEMQAAIAAGNIAAAKAVASARQELSDLIEELANAVATQQAQTYDSVDIVKVSLGAGDTQNYAAIKTEQSARITADDAAAEVSTGLDTRLTDAESNIVGQDTALDTLSTEVTDQGGTLTAQGEAITVLQSAVDDPTTGLEGLATALSDTQATVTDQGGQIATNTDAITSLSGTVGSNYSDFTDFASAQTTANSAFTSDISTVTATSNLGTASGEVGFYAASAPTGYSSAFQVKLTNSGTPSYAGLTLLLDGSGNSVIALDAGQLLIRDASNGLATPTVLFSINSGVANFNVPVTIRNQDIATDAVSALAALTVTYTAANPAAGSVTVSATIDGAADLIVYGMMGGANKTAPGLGTTQLQVDSSNYGTPYENTGYINTSVFLTTMTFFVVIPAGTYASGSHTFGLVSSLSQVNGETLSIAVFQRKK